MVTETALNAPRAHADCVLRIRYSAIGFASIIQLACRKASVTTRSAMLRTMMPMIRTITRRDRLHHAPGIPPGIPAAGIGAVAAMASALFWTLLLVIIRSMSDVSRMGPARLVVLLPRISESVV